MYHFKLCRAILVGFRKQLTVDGTCKEGFIGLLGASMERTEVAPARCMNYGGQILEVEIGGGLIYRDDLTGQVLDPALV